MFRAELVAVMWTLRWVEDKQEHAVLFSDSAATLITIKETESKARPDPLVLQVLCRFHKGMGMSRAFYGFSTHGCGMRRQMRRQGGGAGVQINSQSGSLDYTEIINRAVK